MIEVGKEINHVARTCLLRWFRFWHLRSTFQQSIGDVMATFQTVTADRKGWNLIKTAIRRAGASKRFAGWAIDSFIPLTAVR